MTDPTTDLDADLPSTTRRPYREALEAADPGRLRAALRALGADPGRRSTGLADELIGRLDDPAVVADQVESFQPAERAALGLFSLSGIVDWPADGVAEALRGLGHDPIVGLERPLALGLLAVVGGPAGDDVVALLDPEQTGAARLIAHPSVLEATRLDPGTGRPLPSMDGPARLVRESDGLEPVLRLAALWQLATAGPFKRTRQGELYKRDRQRLDEDPALSGPLADVLRPIDDPVPLWFALAVAVGVIVEDAEADEFVAAPVSFWAEHGVHLPQMLAGCWLAGPDRAAGQGSAVGVRTASLLRLASVGADEWVALDALTADLAGRMRGDALGPPPTAGRGERRRRQEPEPDAGDPFAASVRDALLGPAYLLGLVRVGEGAGGRPAVQLAPRGRYALGLGPPPPPPPKIEKFLFVQPNFEIVAYRQGLNPALIGRLSRFARWVQLGAALTLRLEPDMIDRGLAAGLTAKEIRAWLDDHAVRPLPDGVTGAIATWAGRRERLTYYAAATLIEFGDPEELEAALKDWPETAGPAPIRLAERVLLVEDESSIPFQRFRQVGARDYRRPPEACVVVGPDGVSLAADPSRGDLFVEAELGRFADPIAAGPDVDESLRRQFVVTPESLRRAVDEGISTASLSRWFEHRTGSPPPAAVRLLIRVVESDGNGRPGPLRADRPLVLHTPTSEVLDGLLQHPSTRALLGERLGPTAAVVRSSDAAPLRSALRSIGLELDADR